MVPPGRAGSRARLRRRGVPLRPVRGGGDGRPPRCERRGAGFCAELSPGCPAAAAGRHQGRLRPPFLLGVPPSAGSPRNGEVGPGWAQMRDGGGRTEGVGEWQSQVGPGESRGLGRGYGSGGGGFSDEM